MMEKNSISLEFNLQWRFTLGSMSKKLGVQCTPYWTSLSSSSLKLGSQIRTYYLELRLMRFDMKVMPLSTTSFFPTLDPNVNPLDLKFCSRPLKITWFWSCLPTRTWNPIHTKTLPQKGNPNPNLRSGYHIPGISCYPCRTLDPTSGVPWVTSSVPLVTSGPPQWRWYACRSRCRRG